MLEFNVLETSAVVNIDGRYISLSETDVAKAYGQTYDLCDDDHVGSAVITLGNETVVLSERDWQALFAAIEAYFQDQLEDHEMSLETKH